MMSGLRLAYLGGALVELAGSLIALVFISGRCARARETLSARCPPASTAKRRWPDLLHLDQRHLRHRAARRGAAALRTGRLAAGGAPLRPRPPARFLPLRGPARPGLANQPS